MYVCGVYTHYSHPLNSTWHKQQSLCKKRHYFCKAKHSRVISRLVALKISILVPPPPPSLHPPCFFFRETRVEKGRLASPREIGSRTRWMYIAYPFVLIFPPPPFLLIFLVDIFLCVLSLSISCEKLSEYKNTRRILVSIFFRSFRNSSSIVINHCMKIRNVITISPKFLLSFSLILDEEEDENWFPDFKIPLLPLSAFRAFEEEAGGQKKREKYRRERVWLCVNSITNPSRGGGGLGVLVCSTTLSWLKYPLGYFQFSSPFFWNFTRVL